MSTVALIPARNEPEIGLTVDSILRQTLPVRMVIVVANNCTDDGLTERTAATHGAHVINLGSIPGERAGALNRGLAVIRGLMPETEYVLQMDAGTALDEEFVERTVDAMRAHQRLGVLGPSLTNRKKSAKGLDKFLMWAQWQKLIRSRAEQLPNQTSVPSNKASLLRLKMLDELIAHRGFAWDEQRTVEDHKTTEILQHLGWLCLSDIKFVTYTNVVTA